MQHLFRIAYNIIRNMCLPILWQRDLIFFKKCLKRHDIKELSGEKFIVLVPHSDDEWIGNSMLLRSSQKKIILNMDMGGGDSSKLHSQRRLEMSRVGKRFKYEIVDVTKDKIETLYAILKSNATTYVCLPFFFDWHDEHIEVMKILKGAIEMGINREAFQVAMYPVSCPIPLELINNVEPMTKSEWRDKWNIFKQYYGTQTKIPIRRFALNECITGLYFGYYACESYCVCSIDRWMEMFPKFLLTEKEREELKNSLNGIKETRVLLQKYYKER